MGNIATSNKTHDTSIISLNQSEQTLFKLIPNDLYPTIFHYYNYLLEEGEYNVPYNTNININYYKLDSDDRIMMYKKYQCNLKKQVAMLRLELCGEFQIKPRNTQLWINFSNNSELNEQPYPIIKDCWGLITYNQQWTASKLRDIGVTKDVSILIEFRNTYRKIWEFSGIKYEDEIIACENNLALIEQRKLMSWSDMDKIYIKT